MGDHACFAHLLDDEGRMPDPPRVQIRRVYEAWPPDQGEIRVLVDRVWPRGVRKDSLALDRWAKEIAPTAELRRWFTHDPRKWPQFQRRYREELVARTPELKHWRFSLAEVTWFCCTAPEIRSTTRPRC